MTGMAVWETERKRPPGWRRIGAFCPEEAAPCGEPGQLRWIYWTASLHGERPMAAWPRISDCLAVRSRPWQLIVWEPLETNAPGPHLASPWCCYLQTVIFYHAPHMVSPWRKLWRDSRGHLQSNSKPGHFEEWDKIETRLGWDDLVEFEGETFAHSSGWVLWTAAPGERRRWWMRHGFRRRRAA